MSRKYRTSAAFVDEVSRGLRQGRFLLLICGDGIREGVAAIADFLDRQGTLHFTFGLVEMVIYRTPDDGPLVQPRVLAQSMIFRRTVVSLASETMIADEEIEGDDNPRELSDRERFYEGFWTEFITDLRLDDVSQPLPKLTKKGNAFLAMPSGSNAWVTLGKLERSRPSRAAQWGTYCMNVCWKNGNPSMGSWASPSRGKARTASTVLLREPASPICVRLSTGKKSRWS